MAIEELREALAALPATPPQQPVPDDKVADLLAENAKLRAEIGALESRVPDVEIERAIVDIAAALCWAGHDDNCRKHRDGPETCDCGSSAAVRKARAGVDLLRSAPAPKPCREHPNCPPRQVCDYCAIGVHSKRIDKPVPAPPASDWRERFAKLRLHDRLKASPDAGWCDRVSDASYALRDGLAALEAEVAQLKEKP